MKSLLFLFLAVVSLFLSPAVGLFSGILFALLFGCLYKSKVKTFSKYLLQISVVGLGFGMNLNESLAAGIDGILYTVVSVSSVMIIGYFFGKAIGIPTKMAYLISSGTAICGGSAIAAISPVVDANENETSVSLAVIFTLNAIALFLFPFVGNLLGMDQISFGKWAAIAIHDTSSVVGAGMSYGPEALKVATLIKLTRALWIIPLSLVSFLIFKKEKVNKVAMPWFIFLFFAAMVFATYINLPALLLGTISIASHSSLSLTLFLIGSTLSIEAIKEVGVKPILFGVILWGIISITTILFIY